MEKIDLQKLMVGSCVEWG